MALLDVIGVTASTTYKNLVLSNVFQITGVNVGVESTTEMVMEVYIRELGGTVTKGSIEENVRFRRGSSGSPDAYIQGYDIAIPANSEVYRFGFREVGSPISYTAYVDLDANEVLEFTEAGIMYINEIGFNLSVSLG